LKISGSVAKGVLSNSKALRKKKKGTYIKNSKY